MMRLPRSNSRSFFALREQLFQDVIRVLLPYYFRPYLRIPQVFHRTHAGFADRVVQCKMSLKGRSVSNTR